MLCNRFSSRPASYATPPLVMEDIQSSDNGEQPHGNGRPAEDMPACLSCRKKKLKCSRELPSCSQCARKSSECVYGAARQKPGLRAGAIETLNRRMELIETLLLKQNIQQPPVAQPLPAANNVQGCLYHAALLIASQYGNNPSNNLQTNISARCQSQASDERSDSPERRCGHSHVESAYSATPSSCDDAESHTPNLDPLQDPISFLPSQKILDQVLDAYFSTVHHWIPFIHPTRFRDRLRDPAERNKLNVLVHSMIVVALRQVKVPDFTLNDSAIEHQIRMSRHVVMLNALNDLSIENLQALGLIAFDHIGSANFGPAWAIAGSLIKSVEYLQLKEEPDVQQSRSFVQPLQLLPISRSPAEEEERRRVFWNVFLVDRFLAATSGWDSSLLMQNIHRRLPSNGRSWHSNESVVTPFFHNTAAEAGSPASDSAQGTAAANDEQRVEIETPKAVMEMETSFVGALAFRIEATESLSQVASVFLRQDIDFQNRDDVSKWLTRFRQLDLQLVQWKETLPTRWGHAKVSKGDYPMKMDPNLTAAYLIHNASVILLHQYIAYPPSGLSGIIKLPSSYSSHTCMLAAVEVSSILKRLLSNIDFLLPAQLAYCAFISARVLLVNWRFNGAELSPEFFNIISHLDGMSARWQGRDADNCEGSTKTDIAAKYALELQELHKRALEDPMFWTQGFAHPVSVLLTPGTEKPGGNAVGAPLTGTNGNSATRTGQSLSTTPGNWRARLEAGTSQQPIAANAARAGQGSVVAEDSIDMVDELAEMSQALLDDEFAEMDRVFTLDGTDFAIDMEEWETFMGTKP